MKIRFEHPAKRRVCAALAAFAFGVFALRVSAAALADRWEYVGQILCEPGWHLWGAFLTRIGPCPLASMFNLPSLQPPPKQQNPGQSGEKPRTSGLPARLIPLCSIVAAKNN